MITLATAKILQARSLAFFKRGLYINKIQIVSHFYLIFSQVSYTLYIAHLSSSIFYRLIEKPLNNWRHQRTVITKLVS